MPTVALQPWQMARNDQKIPKIQMDKKYFTQRKKGYSIWTALFSLRIK